MGSGDPSGIDVEEERPTPALSRRERVMLLGLDHPER
jgi:hypothetical protein